MHAPRVTLLGLSTALHKQNSTNLKPLFLKKEKKEKKNERNSKMSKQMKRKQSRKLRSETPSMELVTVYLCLYTCWQGAAPL